MNQECINFPKIQEPPHNSRRQCKFHTDGPQISGAPVRNLAAEATWWPGFVHPCSKLWVMKHIAGSRRGLI